MGLLNAYMALSGAIDGQVQRNVSLARYTSLRVGGPASLLVSVNTLVALRKTLSILTKEKLSWVVLGKGTNVVVSDEGYGGCVILLGKDFSSIAAASEDTHLLTAGAAVPVSKLVNESVSRSLSGLERMVGVPGSFGGALVMNAGTRDEWIGDFVQDVVVLSPQGQIKRVWGSDIVWGYRSSSLQEHGVVLEANLVLKQDTKQAITKRMDALAAHRRATQPSGMPNCGSVFINPDGLSAAQLLESAGAKELRFGKARVSDIHANFVINEGGASSYDIARLIFAMRDAVRSKHGIELDFELRFLGFGA